jgi:CubicO group peptidase (beta-lactamase class C family)
MRDRPANACTRSGSTRRITTTDGASRRRPVFTAGLVRWLSGVVIIGLMVVGLLALLAHVAGPRPWAARAAHRPPLDRVSSTMADSAMLFARVDAYVLREMRDIRAPGGALVIVSGGRVVHARGFGAAAPDGRPVTPSTPFILGSLSKSFTALAVMQLVGSGQIDLDAPVQRYLPTFHVRDRRVSAAITVRQLLNHTSGIPMQAGMLLVAASIAATRAEQMRLLRNVRLSAEPGRAFEYSNANYWLLGLIIESVSGLPYDAYVRRHIFEPLDMRDSFTSEDDAREHGLAQGHRVWFGFPRAETLPYYSRELAVGYLISSPEDMGKYLVAQLNDGRGPESPIISQRGLTTLHTAPDGAPYAMGWLVDSIARAQILWHTGAVANYHSDMLIAPKQDIGVAVFANVNNFLLERQFSEAIKGVGALLLGYDPPRPNALRYRETYWIITLAAGLWILWRVYQVATIRRWTGRRDLARSGITFAWRPEIVAVLLDPGVSVGLVVGLPRFFGAPLSTLRWFVPDLTDWLLLNMALSLIVAASRLLLAQRPR